MKKELAKKILSLLLLLLWSTPSWAETVIERVRRTGVLKAGVRKDAMPFSYLKNQKWQGYSLDLVTLIKEQLEQELNKSIQLEWVEFTVEDRIPKIVKEEIDIICGTTSFTWHRARFVDFSIPFFLTGTQLLIKKGSNLNSLQSLKEKRIGIIPQTTNELVVMQDLPQTILLPIKDGKEGLEALQQGKIDAFAWDGILLEGLRRTFANPNDLIIIPEKPIDQEGYACIFPENNSDFKYSVDYTIVNFMQGIINNETTYRAIFDRWFGVKGIMPVNQTFLLNHFQDIVESHEKIPRYE